MPETALRGKGEARIHRGLGTKDQIAGTSKVNAH